MTTQASDDYSEAAVECGNVAEGADYSEAPVDYDNVTENKPGLEKEFSFGHSLPEPEVELGPAFLSKLQNKGVPGCVFVKACVETLICCLHL